MSDCEDTRVLFLVQYVDQTLDPKFPPIDEQIGAFATHQASFEAEYQHLNLDGPHYAQGPATLATRAADHLVALVEGQRYIFFGTMTPTGGGGGTLGSEVGGVLNTIFFEQKPDRSTVAEVRIVGVFNWFAWWQKTVDCKVTLEFLKLGSGGGDH